jgi:Vault protein inter-alpha-trypsin domain
MPSARGTRFGSAVSGVVATLLLLTLAKAEAAPAQPPAQNPELVARNYRGPNGAQPTHPLTLGNLDISVDIVGSVAHSQILASFQNPTSAPLEGDFTFDLPPGSIVTGYALDVNGTLTEGVLVGQRKAELTYQRKVRQGADPGIAEVTRDNAFRTHVFPIMPGRGRTVRLDFVTPLDADRVFSLPLATLDPVGATSVIVKIADAKVEPSLGAPKGLDLHWEHGAAGLEAHATASNLALAGTLAIGLPPTLDAVTLTRHRVGDTFFEIDAAAPKGDAAPDRPHLVRLYWDRSLSRRHDDPAAEIGLVTRYLGAVKPEAVELVLFADDEPQILKFQSASLAAEAETALKSVEYQGATSLQRVFQAAPGPADTCLFFSDGRVTLDSYRLERLNCPLFTISSALDADHGFLAALARKSGGEHIDLRAGSADLALARLAQRGTRVIGLTDADGADLDFTLLPAMTGRFRVIGREPNGRAVTVALAGGKPLKFDLDGLPVTAHDGPGALWAADRLAELDATDRPDPDKTVGFARRYGIAGSGAVFLVLENLNDYVQAEITPPDSAGKEMQALYAAQVANRTQAKAAADAERLDRVIAEWTEEKAWWNAKPQAQKLPKDARADVPPAATDALRASAQQRPTEALRPDTPPPMPPPPISVAGALSNPMATIAPASAARASSPGASTETNVVTETKVMADVLTPAPASDGKPEASGIEVAVQPWDPKRPYLVALKAAGESGYPAAFTAQEAKYGSQPAFYLDVAEFLFRQGKAAQAIRTALNALELPSADTATLNIVADRMLRYGDEARAVWLYDRVLFLEGDRPQPRRSLALALIERAERSAKRGEPAAAQREDYVRAMALLNEIVTRTWDQAYDGFELVALMEANHIVPRLEKLGVKDIPLDPRLRALLDVDLRVVLEWYVDATDMDLWVDEPTGERAIFNNPRTRIGGRLSHDMTQGYGPEEYLLHRAPGGGYAVRVNIYHTDQLNPNGSIPVRAHLYRAYGRPEEQVQVLEIELTPGEDGTRLVGDIKVAN